MVSNDSSKASKEQENDKALDSGDVPGKDIPVIEISDDDVAKPVSLKRGRLTKDGKVVNNDVVNISSSDEDHDEDSPLTFRRSNKKPRTSSSNQHPFTLIDEETDDDIEVDNSIHISDTVEEGSDEEDGIGLDDLQSDDSSDDDDDGDDLADFIDDEDAPSDDDTDYDHDDF